MTTSHPRRRYLLLIVLLFVAWAMRPPARTGGTEPYFASSLPAAEEARAAADSIFWLLGVAIDSMYVDMPGTLVVSVVPGTNLTPVRFKEGECAGGDHAWRPVQRLATELHTRYAARRNFTKIRVQTPGLSAVEGGWGWRDECMRGQSTNEFGRQVLDSLSRGAS